MRVSVFGRCYLWHSPSAQAAVCQLRPRRASTVQRSTLCGREKRQVVAARDAGRPIEESVNGRLATHASRRHVPPSLVQTSIVSDLLLLASPVLPWLHLRPSSLPPPSFGGVVAGGLELAGCWLPRASPICRRLSTPGGASESSDDLPSRSHPCDSWPSPSRSVDLNRAPCSLGFRAGDPISNSAAGLYAATERSRPRFDCQARERFAFERGSKIS